MILPIKLRARRVRTGKYNSVSLHCKRFRPTNGLEGEDQKGYVTDGGIWAVLERCVRPTTETSTMPMDGSQGPSDEGYQSSDLEVLSFEFSRLALQYARPSLDD